MDNFKVIEYFTKIFIPVYKILDLLHMQKAISDKKHKDVIDYMKQLMEQKSMNKSTIISIKKMCWF